MSDQTPIEIERDVAEAAAVRAAEEGLTVAAYISRLLRRSFERALGEDSILVYDHIDEGSGFDIDRADENDESYKRRCALYRDLFGSR